MKRITILMSFMLFGLAMQAQIISPIKWTFKAKKIAEKTYEIHLSANINPGWHVYSQQTPLGGPAPTKINFENNPLLTLVSGDAPHTIPKHLSKLPKEVGRLETRYEDAFGVNVKYYSEKVDFVKVVKTKTDKPQTLKGTVEYMVCNSTQCLPPEELAFNIKLD